MTTDVYHRSEMAAVIVSDLIIELQDRKPELKYSRMKEFRDWSYLKSVADTILERINNGFDPVMVVQDFAIQTDYFSYLSYESGNYETSDMFATGSDFAMEILEKFIDYGINYEEDFDEYVDFI